MGRIRDKMEQDLVLCGLSAATQEKYLQYARMFAMYLGRSPTTASSADVRRWLLHLLREKRYKPATVNVAIGALKFLFRATLFGGRASGAKSAPPFDPVRGPPAPNPSKEGWMTSEAIVHDDGGRAHCARRGPRAIRMRLCEPWIFAALLGCEPTPQPLPAEGGVNGVDANADGSAAQGVAAPRDPTQDARAAASPGIGTTDAIPTVEGEAGARASWSSYGYDLHNTQVNPHETALSAANVGQLREKWRIRLPSGATSTPVVYDGTVYFGGWDGSAYAADAHSGELRWQRKVTRNQVRSTPAVTQERVYVAAGRNLTALRRADGAILFETELASHPETMLDGSPKVIDDLVIIGVASVDNTFDRPDYTSIGAIVAVDAASGALVWRVPTTGDGPGPCVGGAGASVWSTAAVDEQLGLVFIGTGQSHEEPASTCSDALLAIHYRRNHQGERVAWYRQYTQGDVYASNLMSIWGSDADVGAAPNLFEADGRPLVGAGDKGGSYRAFDRRTGELVWRTDLEHGATTQTGGVMTTAAVFEGTIYVASNKVDASVAEVLLFPQEASAASTLYALDAATGQVRWRVALPLTFCGSFAIANGVLYHNLNSGELYARDPKTGAELWRTDLELPIGVGPSVVNGRLYASAGYALGRSSSDPSAVGGIVVSFGLGDGAPALWDAEIEEIEPVSEEQCRAAVESASEWPNEQRPSAACASCLCGCDATAAGHCDTCWLQAPCTALACPLFPGDLRNCLSLVCTTKLVPSSVFERSVKVAPCVMACAEPCGF